MCGRKVRFEIEAYEYIPRTCAACPVEPLPPAAFKMKLPTMDFSDEYDGLRRALQLRWEVLDDSTAEERHGGPRLARANDEFYDIPALQGQAAAGHDRGAPPRRCTR